MGFLKNIFGTNQNYSVSQLGRDYDNAYKFGTDAYENLFSLGQDMMDPMSKFNLDAQARLVAQGKDSAAETARLMGRNMAQAGGAPAGVVAAQTADLANKTMSTSYDAFNKYLEGTFTKGTGLMSSAANNLTQMRENKMNAMNAQRLENERRNSQASGAFASLAGMGLNAIAPGAGTFVQGLFGQEGGSVPSGLKKVPEGNKGLAKLPQAVRNKMGYMQEGGMLPEEDENKEYMMYGGKVKYNEGGLVSKILDYRMNRLAKKDPALQYYLSDEYLNKKGGGPAKVSGKSSHTFRETDKNSYDDFSEENRVTYLDGPLKGSTSISRFSESVPDGDYGKSKIDEYFGLKTDKGEYNLEPKKFYSKIKMQKGGEVFKPHMMYDKEGKAYKADNMADHLRMQKLGYSHKKGMMYGGKVKYQDGGKVYGGNGGMLSQIQGPKGPMNIPTRMGGYKIG